MCTFNELVNEVRDSASDLYYSGSIRHQLGVVADTATNSHDLIELVAATGCQSLANWLERCNLGNFILSVDALHGAAVINNCGELELADGSSARWGHGIGPEYTDADGILRRDFYKTVNDVVVQSISLPVITE